MKKLLHIIFVLFTIISLNAQVAIGSTTPNANAILDLESSNKGLLLSEVELQSSTSASPLTEHVAGMVVYNTGTSADVTPGIYYNDGASWHNIQGIGPKVGDIKHSVEASNHNGWYLLDGTLLSSLPVNARNNALALGMTTNLPDARGRSLKGKSDSEALGNTGGASSFTLTRENLPSITYTGTTSSAGAHSHSYDDNGAVSHGAVSGTGVSGLAYRNAQDTHTTDVAGIHTHSASVSSGGSDAAVVLIPRSVVVRTFIYLGNN